MLLQELTHRVKNSLQIIAAMVWIEARGHKSGQGKAALERVSHRIDALGHLYSKLSKADTIEAVDAATYLDEQIAGRTIESRYEANLDGVAAHSKNNGGGLCRGLCGYRRCCSHRDNYGRPSADEIRCKRWQPVEMVFGPTILDNDVAALNVAGLRHKPC
jgi:Histidine kinase